jgi:hypothetical protein
VDRIEDEAMSDPHEPHLPREWARVILEAFRVCWAGSRTPDTDDAAQEEIAVWVHDHYPELFQGNPGARVLLPETWRQP